MINDLWYKNAIFYCLSVATYMDANGDGVGDFEGLLRRLDYLQGMGITALWLMPFQCSPGRDSGYDVSDYYAVDPRYGTIGDFVEFTRGCKQRGMQIGFLREAQHFGIEAQGFLLIVHIDAGQLDLHGCFLRFKCSRCAAHNDDGLKGENVTECKKLDLTWPNADRIPAAI